MFSSNITLRSYHGKSQDTHGHCVILVGLDMYIRPIHATDAAQLTKLICCWCLACSCCTASASRSMYQAKLPPDNVGTQSHVDAGSISAAAHKQAYMVCSPST
jgi:hypothetical protein